MLCDLCCEAPAVETKNPGAEVQHWEQAHQKQQEQRRKQEEARREAEARASQRQMEDEAQAEKEQDELNRFEKEQQERERAVNAWLKKHKFTGVNAEKKIRKALIFSGITYPLHEAVKSKDVKMAQLLVASGADVSKKNKKGLMAIDIAKKNKNQSMIAVLS